MSAAEQLHDEVGARLDAIELRISELADAVRTFIDAKRKPSTAIGWKAIGDVIERCEDTCQKRADDAFDPLPVFWEDGRPMAYIDALLAWRARQRASHPITRRLQSSERTVDLLLQAIRALPDEGREQVSAFLASQAPEKTGVRRRRGAVGPAGPGLAKCLIDPIEPGRAVRTSGAVRRVAAGE